jgi:predicted amidohydrolase
MITAFYQFTPRIGKRKENLEKIRKGTEKKDFDLLVLPELCTTGYALTPEELNRFSEPVPDGPTVSFMLDYSREKRSTMVWGMAERDGDRFYNSAVVAHNGFFLGKYRKVHLFLNEKDLFSPGDLPFTVWDISGVRMGVMICFDWAYPEAARTLAFRGAHIVAHPANLVLPLCEKAMPVRAIENRIFTVTANRTGEERGLRFTGKSLICGPGGKILSRAGRSPAFGSAEITPLEASDKRLTPRNSLFEDRRPSFYL